VAGERRRRRRRYSLWNHVQLLAEGLSCRRGAILGLLGIQKGKAARPIPLQVGDVRIRSPVPVTRLPETKGVLEGLLGARCVGGVQPPVRNLHKGFLLLFVRFALSASQRPFDGGIEVADQRTQLGRTPQERSIVRVTGDGLVKDVECGAQVAAPAMHRAEPLRGRRMLRKRLRPSQSCSQFGRRVAVCLCRVQRAFQPCVPLFGGQRYSLTVHDIPLRRCQATLGGRPAPSRSTRQQL
jgi:hypothetical protein